MHNFLERLPGPAIHSSEDVNINGDQPQTIDLPVIMPTDLDDNSTKVARGRIGIMKRFRRWAGKRLRPMCCVCIPRDDSSCRKDACRVDDIGHNGNRSSNNRPAKKPKNGNETKINGITDPLIITKESNTLLNNAHSVQNFPKNIETVFKSNKNDNNTEPLGDSLPRMLESNLPRENGKRRDERISVHIAEPLISETDECGGIVKTTKSTTSLQIDNASPDKIVSFVTTVTQSFRDENYSMADPNNDQISKINDMKLSHENIQRQDEQISANKADHSISEKYEHTQLQTKPTTTRKLDIDSKRDFVFKTKAANHILRKQNPIAMPRYENLPCSRGTNLQRSDKQARKEQNSVNTAESRIFEKYERRQLQTKPTTSQKLDIDSKRDFVFKTKAANHILRKQQDPIAVHLYKDRPCSQERKLQRDNEHIGEVQSSVNKAEPRIFEKHESSHLQTKSTTSRKLDINSNGKFVSISAAKKYHFKKRQDSITIPRYENLSGLHGRKLQRDNEQTGDEQSSVNTAEPCIFKKHQRSLLQTTFTASQKLAINAKGKLVSISATAKYNFKKRQDSITMSRYENLTESQERKSKENVERSEE